MTRTLDLVVTLGTSGCGKTRDADLWVAESPGTRAHESKDAARVELGVYGNRDANTPDVEQRVWAHELAAVRKALDAGRDVIVADTCQDQAAMDQWVALAFEYGARLVVWDYRAVPPQVCEQRDRERGDRGGRRVGAAAIERIAARCAEVVASPSAVVRDMATQPLG